MRRRYTPEDFIGACDLLREVFPGCAITTDVICGFPGETDAEFEETRAFCREIGFARMHVFPYSARQGTIAAQMSGQVPRALREERARLLIADGNEMALRFAADKVGGRAEVLVEETDEEGISRGYTAEYLPCAVRGGEPGSVYGVRVLSAGPEGLTGEIIAEKA